MPPAEPALPLRHAVALGLLQGPAELLPVSSSAHTALVPWLARWPYAELDGGVRKSIEVGLHAGTGAALGLLMRDELQRELRTADPRRLAFLGASLAPPALAGAALRSPIERRLGGPRSIAAGLVAGALAMALADAGPAGGRRCADAGPADGLALGLAQAAALIPGVSRSGATIAAARGRGFGRGAAQSLSWGVALPVIAGAGMLTGVRALRRGAPARAAPFTAVGGASAFVSTLAAARLLALGGAGGREPAAPRAARPLLPYALYRCALAGLVVRRLRRAQ